LKRKNIREVGQSSIFYDKIRKVGNRQVKSPYRSITFVGRIGSKHGKNQKENLFLFRLLGIAEIKKYTMKS